MSTVGILERLRGGLVVSCQAPPGDPLHGPVGVEAGLRGQERGQGPGQEEEGRAGGGEARAPRERQPPEEGAHHEEHDREVDDDRVVRGEIGHKPLVEHKAAGSWSSLG